MRVSLGNQLVSISKVNYFSWVVGFYIYGVNGFVLSFVEAMSDTFVILLFSDVACSEMPCACFLVDRGAGVVLCVVVLLLLLLLFLLLLLLFLSLLLLLLLLSLLLSLLLKRLVWWCWWIFCKYEFHYLWDADGK